MVGMSVKPWFPNLEKKNKKDLVNRKTLPTFVKQIGNVRRSSLKILFIHQDVDDETLWLILR
jgi:hypothetical protein